MKKLLVLAMAAGLIASMTACGGKEEAKPTTGGDKPATSSAASGGGAAGNEVKIVATNFKFDQAEYKVKKGEEIKVSLDNKEGIHGIEIKGLDVKLDATNKATTFKADKPGKYDIVCSIPCGQGHLAMKSTLVIE